MFESYWSAGHNEKALKPEIPPAYEQNWDQPFKYLRDTTMLSVWHWCCEFVLFLLVLFFIFCGISGHDMKGNFGKTSLGWKNKQITFLNKKSHHPIKKYGNAKIILVMNYCVFFMSKNEIRLQTTKYFSQIFLPDYCCLILLNFAEFDSFHCHKHIFSYQNSINYWKSSEVCVVTL